MQLLNESWYETSEKGGFYYTDRADRLPDRDKGRVNVTYRQARTKSFFETAACDASSPTYKGDFARFSYEHKIGLYFTNDKSFAKWFGEESHYDEDHFFYIDNFRGADNEFDGKDSIAFQLRVSNHPVVHEQWERSHANPSNIRAEFCLNFILNPDGRKNEGPRDSINRAVTSIDCDISDYYRGMEPERVAFIDNFIKKVVNGEQPHISYDDVLYMGGKTVPNVRRSGNSAHWEGNFGKRSSLSPHRDNYGFIDAENDKQAAQISSEIPLDAVIEAGAENTGDEFEYKGRTYRFDAENYIAYPQKTRRGNTYFDENSPVAVVAENKIKFSHGDLMEMVARVLKSLIC